MKTENPQYEMTLSLTILNHLGFGLYSNISAVLSEVVANAWDADAEHVWITIDKNHEKVVIQDDGHGMTIEDANRKYLCVGYERRKNAPRTPHFNRPVMGRKGIGKLSLFSIARTVEVHSVKDNTKHGFSMDVKEIKEMIKDETEGKYSPRAIPIEKIGLDRGTRIVLSNIERKLAWTEKPLKKRLARRFSIIGSKHNFEIYLNNHPVTIDDRDYQDKIQYIWTFGELGMQSRNAAKNQEAHEERPGQIGDDPDSTIEGWIGTAFKSGQLNDPDTKDSINKIVIMVRGKLAQENILDTFGEGGLYTKYIFGEIHADFLDLDNEDDIANTDRQSFIEEDFRYKKLWEKLRRELRYIEGKWTELRNTQGSKQAFSISPQIEKWFDDLNPDQKQSAKKLLGRINQLPIDDPNQKRQLLVSGVLAFESMKFRNMLHRLDNVSVENLEVLNDVFIQLDDLEASAYYQITKDRLDVIQKLTGLADENAKERALQEHLFQHLWILDPSWERATHTSEMEKRIRHALRKNNESLTTEDSLTEEESRARFDIYYQTNVNKHVIIELKRANRILGFNEIHNQLRKYYTVAKKVLDFDRKDEPLDIVCVVGKMPQDWDDPSRKSLEAFNARIVTYDQLIENARNAYKDYLERHAEAGRIYRFIKSISEQDVRAISPISD